MVTCDYCNSKLQRHAFCSNAHKMQYHRTHVTERNTVATKKSLDVTKSNNSVTEGNKVDSPVTNRNVLPSNSLCQHYQMKGLCKKGCK